MTESDALHRYARDLLGELPDNWQMVRLGDLKNLGIIEDIQDGNHGERHPKSSDYVPSGVPFVMAKDLVHDRLNLADCSFIAREQADRLRIGFAKPGDVLLTHKATMGRVAIVPAGHDFIVLTPQVTYYRIGKPNALSNGFLKYAFLSPVFQHQLNSGSDQSTRKYIGISAQRDLWIPLPPLAEQHTIAAMLGALDDKIDLNRRMNETLEALAQALFRSWFVDFEPFRSKNGPFILDSEMGELPRGWEVRALYDCAGYINGSAFKNDDFSPDRQGLPVIKIGELKDGITGQTKFTSAVLESKYRITSGDILFSWSGSPDTSIDTFVWTGEDGWLNQHIFKIQFNRPMDKFFMHFLLRRLKPVFIEIARNKQTTGLGHVTAQDLKRLKTIFPPDDVLLAFNSIAEPLFQKAYNNSCESRTLAALRDTLLPRLLSGELRITKTGGAVS